MTLLQNVPWLTIVVTFLIPVATALLSRPAWATKAITGLITLALSALTGFFTEWYQADQANHAYNWHHGLSVTVTSFVVAVLAHQGILSQTTEYGKLLNVGAGPKQPVSTHPHPGPDVNV